MKKKYLKLIIQLLHFLFTDSTNFICINYIHYIHLQSHITYTTASSTDGKQKKCIFIFSSQIPHLHAGRIIQSCPRCSLLYLLHNCKNLCVL